VKAWEIIADNLSKGGQQAGFYKNPNSPRYIALDFLQYLYERQNRLKKPNRKKHENNK
jgi:hypothetical protein